MEVVNFLPWIYKRPQKTILSSHTNPVKYRGASALLRHQELVLANLPGGGLVPHRWGCVMPRVMMWAPEVPPH